MIPWVIGKYIFKCSTRSSSPSAVPFVGTWIGLALVAIRYVCLLDALSNGLGVWFPTAGYVDPARDAMPRHDRLEARIFGQAALDGIWAAGLERAALRRVDQIGWQPFDRHQLFLARLVQARNGFQ